MKTVFSVDGQQFNIAVINLERSATLRGGDNEGTAISGRKIRDLTGTYYDYKMTLGTRDMGGQDYDSLYEILTAPVDSHNVVMPYGQTTLTFEAYIEEVNDSLKRMGDAKNLWGYLEVTFTATRPQRIPD